MNQPTVLLLKDLPEHQVKQLLDCYQIKLRQVATNKKIPGSYWGDKEAGLVRNTLFARCDTPVHSILHESCHYICMDDQRREQLDTDAGGSYNEENAVCYLQILLADRLPDMGKSRMIDDMDRWGYSFRLGSALQWFEQDASDARLWLKQKNLINGLDQPNFQLNH